MIKFAFSRKLIYLLIYFGSWFACLVINIAINRDLGFGSQIVFLWLLTIGKLLGGTSVYIYQYKSLKHNQKTKYFGLELLYNKDEIKPADQPLKILLLIFFAAGFDSFFSYYNLVNRAYYPKYGCITTIISSFICAYTLKLKVSKHQRISRLFMSIFLIFVIILEIVYMPDIAVPKYYIFTNFLLIFQLIMASLTDCIEKYIVEANFISPFKVIMFEGCFELIFSIIISVFHKDPIDEFNKKFTTLGAGLKAVLIFLCTLYTLITGIVNAYKVYCNVIYSPMSRSLIDYFMAPGLNAFSFTDNKTLYNHNSIVYIVLSELFAVLIDFFGLVYNEFIILYFFGLEYETQKEISQRGIDSDRLSGIMMEDLEDSNDFNDSMNYDE